MEDKGSSPVYEFVELHSQGPRAAEVMTEQMNEASRQGWEVVVYPFAVTEYREYDRDNGTVGPGYTTIHLYATTRRVLKSVDKPE